MPIAIFLAYYLFSTFLMILSFHFVWKISFKAFRSKYLSVVLAPIAFYSTALAFQWVSYLSFDLRFSLLEGLSQLGDEFDITFVVFAFLHLVICIFLIALKLRRSIGV